jgi:hypothetical protein
MAKIKEQKYIYINNFLNKEELELLQIYCKNKLQEDWKCDEQSPFSPSWYKDTIMNSLLEKKLKSAEEISGLKLFKTYAFWRYYVHGAILKDHIDRPSCEISITACIHKTENWPIHMNGTWIEIKEGDAVMYLGCEVNHGREPFNGDGCAQVFLHYVDQEGPFKQYKEDNTEENIWKN